MKVKNGCRWECDEGGIHIHVSGLAFADMETLCGHASGVGGKPSNRKVNCDSCIAIATSVINECTIEKPKVKKRNPKHIRLDLHEIPS